MAKISAIICADWGKEKSKRAAFVADVAGRIVKQIPGSDWSLETLIAAAVPWRERGPVLITFDAPLGVPASYLHAASECPRWGGPGTFLEFVRCVWADPGYLDLIVNAEGWTVGRPFFAVPAGEGGLTSFLKAAERAGVDLYRTIDRLTKAKTVFANRGFRDR